MSIAETNESKVYYRPSSDGKITRKITKEEYERRIALDPKDNVRARAWKTPKEEGIAYEEFYSRLRGRIVAISIREHETYGRSIAVTLRSEDGEEGVFSVGTNAQYGMNFMERLPNVDFEREVTIIPWVKEVGERKRYSILLNQGEDRVESKFKSYDADTKTWTQYEGYPEVNEKEKTKFGDKYWSRYYGECEVFLCEYVENKVAPLVNSTVEVVEEKKGGIDPSTINF
jgi:hypothetical protein